MCNIILNYISCMYLSSNAASYIIICIMIITFTSHIIIIL